MRSETGLLPHDVTFVHPTSFGMSIFFGQNNLHMGSKFLGKEGAIYRVPGRGRHCTCTALPTDLVAGLGDLVVIPHWWCQVNCELDYCPRHRGRECSCERIADRPGGEEEENVVETRPGEGSSSQGSTNQGSTNHGPNGQGPNGQGPNFQGPTVQGPNMQWPTNQGPFQGPFGPYPAPMWPSFFQQTPYQWPFSQQRPSQQYPSNYWPPFVSQRRESDGGNRRPGGSGRHGDRGGSSGSGRRRGDSPTRRSNDNVAPYSGAQNPVTLHVAMETEGDEPWIPRPSDLDLGPETRPWDAESPWAVLVRTESALQY